MKLVLRLMSTDDRLLGWTEHYAQLRGDGCLRASHDVTIQVEADGMPRDVSIHWCDVNVETRVPIMGQIFREVKVGDMVTVFRYGSPMIQVGPMPGPLPPVTVKSVAVGVPVGQLGAIGNR